jgi:hypothetical protein
MATKKGITTNFFASLSFIAVLDPGSGMGKKTGSGIRDKHSGSATLVFGLKITNNGPLETTLLRKFRISNFIEASRSRTSLKIFPNLDPAKNVQQKSLTHVQKALKKFY